MCFCFCDAADPLQALLTLQVFAEIFDPVIKARHNGYDPRTMKHHTDLDASKVGLTKLHRPELLISVMMMYATGLSFSLTQI